MSFVTSPGSTRPVGAAERARRRGRVSLLIAGWLWGLTLVLTALALPIIGVYVVAYWVVLAMAPTILVTLIGLAFALLALVGHRSAPDAPRRIPAVVLCPLAIHGLTILLLIWAQTRL